MQEAKSPTSAGRTPRTNLVRRVSHARPVVVLQDQAANDALAAELREHHMDEYRTGLDDVPTARMERDDPDRWSDPD